MAAISSSSEIDLRLSKVQALHDCLENVAEDDLRHWSRGNLCQIKGLATAVLEGLDLWQYTAAILAKLCAIAEFRDYLWDVKPDLLSILLQRASASDERFDQYATVCSLLSLSRAQHAFPAAYPEFLECTLHRIAHRFSNDTMQLLLVVLRTLESVQLENISSNVIRKLQVEARELLKASGKDPSKDHLTQLRCFAVFSCFRKLHSNVRRKATSMHDETSQISEDFFSPSTVQKMAPHLLQGAIETVMRSASGQLTLDQSKERLCLAIDVFKSIMTAVPAGWQWKHKSAFLQKLLDKIADEDVDADIRGLALDLVLTLSDGLHNPISIANITSRLLREGGIDKLSTAGIQGSAPLWTQTLVVDLVYGSLYIAKNEQQCSLTVLRKLEGAIHLLHALSNEHSMNCSLMSLLSSANEAETFSKAFEDLAAFMKRRESAIPISCVALCCPGIVHSARARLYRELRKYLVLLASRSPRSDQPFASLVSTLLLSENSQDCAEPICKHSMESSRQSSMRSPTFSTASHLGDGVAGRDWRDSLAAVLSKNAEQCKQGIIDHVSEVCRDLEARCHSVEAPLRAKQSEVQTLSEQLRMAQVSAKQLQQQLTESETSREAADRRIEATSVKLTQLESQHGHVSEELIHIRVEVRSLRAEISQTSESAALAVMQADKKNMEIIQERDAARDEAADTTEHMQASIEALDRIVAEKDNQLSKCEQDVKQRDSDIAQLRKGCQNLSESNATLESLVKSLRSELIGIKAEKDSIHSARHLDLQRYMEASRAVQDLLSAANVAASNSRTALVEQQDLLHGVREDLDSKLCTLRKQLTESQQSMIMSESSSKSEIDDLRHQLARLREINQELRRCLSVCGPPVYPTGRSSDQSPGANTTRVQYKFYESSSPSSARKFKRPRQSADMAGKPQPGSQNSREEKPQRRSLHQPFRQPLAESRTVHNRGTSSSVVDLPHKGGSSPPQKRSPTQSIPHDDFSDVECESTRYGDSQAFGSQASQHQIAEGDSRTAIVSNDEDETRAE